MSALHRTMIALAAAAALLATALPVNARAGDARDRGVSMVSGRSYTSPPGCQSQGVDSEVSLARDPASGRMVAAWMQDIAPTPAESSEIVITASSSDGGRRWRRSVPPGVMRCEQPPGPGEAVWDPSVSVGPDHRWYLGRLGQPVTSGAGSVYVATSMDGMHWSSPVPTAPIGLDDFDTVVADPKTPGRAYVTWSDIALAEVLIAVTTNGGRTFSPPVTVHQAPNGYVDDPSRLVVLSDDSLLDVYGEASLSTYMNHEGPVTLYATRSTDGGATWSRPARVSSYTVAEIVDPDTGASITGICCGVSLAAGPNDSAEAAWTSTKGTRYGDVSVASTSDAGKHWSVASIHRPAQAFEAAVAASRDGPIAVMWYDFTGDRPGDGKVTTRVWLAQSSGGSQRWKIIQLGGSFNIRSVPSTAEQPTGDFQSLVQIGSGFEAAFTMAKPQAQHGPTDIFAAGLPRRITDERRASGPPMKA